jgi:hypothetical protein
MSGSKPLLKDEKAMIIVRGEMASKDKAIVAMSTPKMVIALEILMPTKTTLRSNAEAPNKMLLSKANTTIEPHNR